MADEKTEARKKADNSGDQGNVAVSQASDDQTTKADPLTVDRGDMEGQFDAVEETNRVRQQIIDASEPGTDPDSKRRLAKHLAAAGEDVPDHLKTGNDPRSDYPYDTDSDKLKDAGIPDRDNAGNPNPHADDDDTKGDAAKARKAGSTTRTTAPQGRSATPTQKAAG